MKNKIKILHFPIANSYGGITHYALNNWKFLNKDIFQCDFATLSPKLDFAEELTAMGSKIHYISCYAEDNRVQFSREVNEILNDGYDIVHLHTKQWKSFLFEQICMARKVSKVIVHSHSTRCDANDAEVREQEMREHYQVREQFSEDMATDFWACSEEAADWLFGDRIPKGKICILKNAIEAEKFVFNSKIRERLRREYGIEKKFVIGSVGRLVYQKNQSFLIEAFAKAYKEMNNLELILIGDGELRYILEERILDLGIAQAVYFLGKKANVNVFYQMMDLFVLPSNFEGFPIALVEAQASGLKCLCSHNIPKDIDLTGNVDFLSLDVDKWTNEIIKKAKYYDRKDMTKIIIDKGYDLKTQIKEIEKMYLESNHLFGGVKLKYNFVFLLWMGECA